ncbi:MAG: nucleoside-diphosphate kinase [Patescibacteria group bacterium]
MKKMKQERTLVLIKPDAVKRSLTGEVIQRIESRGLKVIALQMIWPDKEKMEKHYPTSEDWVTGLGKNTARAYEEFQLPTTLLDDYGTDDLHQIGKQVREWLIEFMISGPIVKIVIEGLHAVKMVRKIVGHTIPAFADMGTIRGDFSVDSPALANTEKRPVQNLIHASGNAEEAAYEIAHWFTEKELHSFVRTEEDLMP